MLFSSKVGYFTDVIDVVTKKKLYMIPPPKDERLELKPPSIYLVESAGEILRVCWKFEIRDGTRKPVFCIHKLAFDGKERQ
jgi:hypothetical protein